MTPANDEASTDNIRLDRALAAMDRLWQESEPTLLAVKIALAECVREPR